MSYFDDVMELIEKYNPLPEKKESPRDEGVTIESEGFKGTRNFLWWIKQEHLEETEIIQEMLTPVLTEEKRGWFRIPVFSSD